MIKRLKNNKGVTLIELLVAMAVLSLLAMGIITVLSSGLKTYSVNMESTQGQQSMRQAMIQVTKLVRDPAKTASVSSGKLYVNGTVLSVASGKLKWGSVVFAGENIASIAAAYADVDKKVIQVDLKSTDGGTLSTKISLN
jgi:prepilin-type N-terminal cleavage/methylation domain-containing protein